MEESLESFDMSICEDTPLVEKVTRSLQSSGLLCAAGIATSLTNSEING